MTWGIPPPNPDPLLEAKYARPRSFKDMAGGLLLGLIAFVIVLYPMLRGDLRISRVEGGLLLAAFIGWLVLEIALVA